MSEGKSLLKHLLLVKLNDLDLSMVGRYLIVDFGQEGANAKTKGVLRLEGEAKGEDAPGRSVCYDLILSIFMLLGLGQLPILCLHFTK